MDKTTLGYAAGLGIVLMLALGTGAVFAFQHDMNQNIQLVRFQSNTGGSHTALPGSGGNSGMGNNPVPLTKKLSPPEMRACFDSCMTSGLGTGPGGSNAKFCAKSCH